MSLKNQYHTQGLSTYTELILGLPKETPKTFLDDRYDNVSQYVRPIHGVHCKHFREYRFK